MSVFRFTDGWLGSEADAVVGREGNPTQDRVRSVFQVHKGQSESGFLTAIKPYRVTSTHNFFPWVSPNFTDTFIKLVKIEGNVRDVTNGITQEIQPGVQV